jgi:hypothetical protein
MEVCHETTNGNPFNPLVLMSSVGASGYIPVRNGKIPEHIQHTKLEPGERRKPEHSNNEQCY